MAASRSGCTASVRAPVARPVCRPLQTRDIAPEQSPGLGRDRQLRLLALWGNFMLGWMEEYAKHSVLNFAQALHGLRYFLSHPDIDVVAKRGTPRHVMLSAARRSGRVLNDLVFAILPPRLHHSRQELREMRATSFKRWFQYGYCAWRFTDTGAARQDVSNVDRRWDPRCDDS